jgi:hypothetical protein
MKAVTDLATYEFAAPLNQVFGIQLRCSTTVIRLGRGPSRGPTEQVNRGDTYTVPVCGSYNSPTA